MAEIPWKNLTRTRRWPYRPSLPSAPWLHSVLLLLLLLGHSDARRPIMTPERKLELRDLVKKTWYHGFDNYINHAFPHDELRPISCTGIGQDRENPTNYEINDVLGDFSMTMIDTLDTFVALRDVENFGRAVRRIAGEIRDFDKDSKVQVFETTIRVLGGLLSGHLFAHDPENVWGHRVDGYNDELLDLAKDLADRLLPAFLRSPTGIPYARVNLRHGVVSGEGTETCTAGAGSLLLEFATLSRLLGDPMYEEWSYGVSSIGAGIDSFYEYILKSHILLQDQSFLEIWNQAYKAVMTYMRSPDGFWYRGVNMQTGAVATSTIDSLAAFWPGLQVLAGDVEAAIQSHMTYANLWASGGVTSRYSGIPEVFDIHRRQATSLGYPLRPEFIESNYFLYRATKDEFYLDVAERVLTDLVNRTWVDCGLASIANLVTGQLEDRQHSFMLSETLKYLYLTFDEDNPINHADEPFVFTTEGHILYIPPEAANSTDSQDYSTSGWEERESLDSDRVVREKDMEKKHTSKPATCPVFSSSLRSADKDLNPFGRFFIDQRTDFDYARFITGAHHSPINYLNLSPATPAQSDWADSFGFCQVPLVHEELIELIFSHSEAGIERRPGPEKVEFSASPASASEMVVVKNITGLTFSLKKDWNDDTYEIVKVGGYDLSPKTQVMLTDEYAVKVLKPTKESTKISARDRDHLTGIRVFYSTGSEVSEEEGGAIERPVMMATFGPDVREAGAARLSLGMEALEVVGPGAGNKYGCAPMRGGSGRQTVLMEEEGGVSQQEVAGKVVLVKRGECTFLDKLRHAYEAGGVALIVVNTDEGLLIPTSDRLPARDEGSSDALRQQHMDHMAHIPLLFAAQETGSSIAHMLANRSAPDAPHRQVLISIKDQPLALLDALNDRLLASAPVVINGYRLRNLKLSPS
ncbi:hypothetical protein VP01_1381g3 [Puccinia sorghi]|uniref:alpha-1,2-Mannosidase n=1 Tax=Puccinia sorghi TaxID=27349 RepID=A0A0L6VLK6_9BASI|nr:hypothetical protein VP01_1381g3 [Puccinia sorghi]